jgi:hypothetical protein
MFDFNCFTGLPGLCSIRHLKVRRVLCCIVKVNSKRTAAVNFERMHLKLLLEMRFLRLQHHGTDVAGNMV